MTKIFVNDNWLWSQISIVEEVCKECGSGNSIRISKGKDLAKLIKTLQKYNYKGIPKKNKFDDKRTIIKDFE